MPKVTPFQSIRPASEFASRIAALPYDVYNRKEACEVVKKEPLSFLKIDRAETQFSDDVSTYDPMVYEKAKELLLTAIKDGHFVKEETPCYYIYELIMDGRSQTGIVACSDIDDYTNGIIKKHENTREEKEIDRINHVNITDTHTGPIFLAYRSKAEINEIVNESKASLPMLYDFTSDDGITHRAWCISDTATISKLEDLFAQIPFTYIADGHHRCASAVKVGLNRRAENPNYTGNEEFNRFLSVLFPDDQLAILPYNRVVTDLNGQSKEAFLDAVQKAGFQIALADAPVAPSAKGTFGMFLDEQWYLLTADTSLLSTHPVDGLDVSILQNNLLGPILGIGDPRIDKRIDFVGGIRGLSELEKRVSEDMTVAFSMYPTSIEELLEVADAGLLMPPKSTWFEPKLRSGLFLHSLT